MASKIPPKFPRIPPRLIAIGLGCAAGGVLLIGAVGAAARGCGGKRVDELEARVARLESRAGIVADAGAGAAETPIPSSSGSAQADAPQKAACDAAKAVAYQAWQDALSKAKTNAHPAEAECSSIWSEKKKRGCYYMAQAGVRTAQAARDNVMKGGIPAREAVKAVKDDPKNEATARARAASEAAFATCQDENEF